MNELLEVYLLTAVPLAVALYLFEKDARRHPVRTAGLCAVWPVVLAVSLVAGVAFAVAGRGGDGAE